MPRRLHLTGRARRVICRLFLVACCVLTASELSAQTTHDAPLLVLALFPGDARSVDFSFDNDFAGRESVLVALIAAVVPDQEIHQLTITLSPRGDVGPELGYATGGLFINLNGGAFNILEVLDPKFTYGFDMVRYIVNVNPYVSLGMLIASATTSFSAVDFPVAMTMTAALSP